MLTKFVVIDLETTGNNPKTGDRIIQFAAVVVENGMIIERFSSLINPNRSIPTFIGELTGLNDEMVKDAPLFSEIASKVNTMLEGAYFVAHNVLFDLSFLQEELIQAGYEGFYGFVLDTVEMARFLFPTADGYKLSDLAEQENLTHDRPHQADSDAEVTAELLIILMKMLTALPNRTIQQLSLLSGGLKSDLQQLMEEILAEKVKEVEILPESIEIHHELALKKLATDEINISYQDIHQYPASEEGKIELVKQGIQSFEKRTGQFVMMDGVYDSFQNNTHALIEAGTGVGKSLGYLLPVAYFSKQKMLPVVVSTHTIQLQEQILYKEIPLLAKMLPFKVKSVLLKGRNHYLCLEKFTRALREENDNYDTSLTKMQILVWLTRTETGDRDELNLSSGGNIFWNKIRNEQTNLTRNNTWLEKDFYLRAKSSAKDADIIITNHSLLLSELTGDNKILPEFDYVIIDEGHHFEKAASQFVGLSLDYLSTRLLINQFGQYEQRLLFYELEQLFAVRRNKKEEIAEAEKINQLMADLSYEVDEFFKLTAIYAKSKSTAKRNKPNKGAFFSRRWRERKSGFITQCRTVFFFA